MQLVLSNTRRWNRDSGSTNSLKVIELIDQGNLNVLIQVANTQADVINWAEELQCMLTTGLMGRRVRGGRRFQENMRFYGTPAEHPPFQSTE